MKRLLVIGILLLIPLSSSAEAQMLGESLEAEWYFPDWRVSLENHSVSVSNNVELPNTTIQYASNLEIDIGDNWVEFRFLSLADWGNSSFNGWIFRDTSDSLPPIMSYEVDSFSSGVGGLSNIVTGFNENEFWADFGGVTGVGPDDWIRLAVTLGGPPELEVTQLVPGLYLTLRASQLEEASEVTIAVSSLGPGPTSTPFGLVEVSLPWRSTPNFPADQNGEFEFTTTLPAGASGSTLYLQAVEFKLDGTTELSNPLAVSIP